jgi:hypothetical protein
MTQNTGAVKMDGQIHFRPARRVLGYIRLGYKARMICGLQKIVLRYGLSGFRTKPFFRY